MSVRGNTSGEYFGEWFGPVEVVPGGMSANLSGSGGAVATLTAAAAPVVVGGGGGGGGGRIRFQIIYPNVKRGKTLDKKIGEWIEAIVAGEPVAEEPPAVAQVRKVVKPYVREDTIDLAAMQRDAKQVRMLLETYEADVRRRADEEDEELLMMVL